VNLGLALSIILVAVSVRRATEFSVFPTLLLFVTLFRLALNVSSTRLILSHGLEFDGFVVRSFGDFMAGDSSLVGGVVFAILVTIQYLVISAGAERISQVAARFQLDSLPVRIMAIESQQTAQLISLEEARDAREQIQKESDFHSAMEGASRFIKGENMASVLILIINLVGGTCAGWSRVSEVGFMSLASAISLLTIGDGLVNLIASLLVSTAAGIIVTRVDSQLRLSEQLVQQIGSEPRNLVLTLASLGGILIAFGFLGNKMSFLSVLAGAGLVGLAYHVYQGIEEIQDPVEEVEDEGAAHRTRMMDLIVARPFDLILSQVDADLLNSQELAPGALLARVREKIAGRLGVLLPPGTWQVAEDLKPGSWELRVMGSPIGRGRMDASIPGADARLESELVEISLSHAPEIMRLEETREIIDELARVHPTSTEPVRAGRVPLARVHQVLQQLLRDRVSIRNIVRILEVVSTRSLSGEEDPFRLAEEARVALGRQILSPLASDEGHVRTLVLDPELERALDEALRLGGGRHLAMKPPLARAFLQALKTMTDGAKRMGQIPVVTVPGHLRPHVARFAEKSIGDLVVLSFAEYGRSFNPRRIGTIRLPREQTGTD